MSKLRKTVSAAVIFALLLVSGPATFAAPNQAGHCTGEVYVVQANDWLSKLADKTYGDVLAYPQIVDATNHAAESDDTFATIENPDVIEIGWTLCIPAAEGEAMMADDTEGEAMADKSEGEGEAMASDDTEG